MAEHNSHWNEGLGFSDQFLDHHLYLLSCIVHASPTFDRLNDDSLRRLRASFQEAEIGQLLLTVVVGIRHATDNLDSSYTEFMKTDGENDGCVGKLIINPDSERESKTELTLREACNKLIHSQSFSFDYASETPQTGMAINPLVHVFGAKGSENWKASIDLDQFISIATRRT